MESLDDFIKGKFDIRCVDSDDKGRMVDTIIDKYSNTIRNLSAWDKSERVRRSIQSGSILHFEAYDRYLQHGNVCASSSGLVVNSSDVCAFDVLDLGSFDKGDILSLF